MFGHFRILLFRFKYFFLFVGYLSRLDISCSSCLDTLVYVGILFDYASWIFLFRLGYSCLCLYTLDIMFGYVC